MLFCGVFVWCVLSTVNNSNVLTDTTQIPQGAFEQIILDYGYITDEEICRIYSSDVAYWNEVDRQMCED